MRRVASQVTRSMVKPFASTLLRPSLITTKVMPIITSAHRSVASSTAASWRSSSLSKRAVNTTTGLVMFASLLAITTPSSVMVTASPSSPSPAPSAALTTTASSAPASATSVASSVNSNSNGNGLRLFVTGATGGTGIAIISQAIAAGHYVTAIVRSPEKITLHHERLRIIKGDATRTEDIIRAMNDGNGHDLTNGGNGKLYDGVLNALGTAAFSEIISPPGGEHIEVTGTRALIAGMQNTGSSRLIVCSSNGVADSRRFTPWHLKKLYEYLFASKDIQEDMVRKSSLSWTIVRPTGLVDGEHRGVGEVEPVIDGPVVRNFISRNDVAAFMLQQVTSPTYIHRAPAISWRRPLYSWQFW